MPDQNWLLIVLVRQMINFAKYRFFGCNKRRIKDCNLFFQTEPGGHLDTAAGNGVNCQNQNDCQEENASSNNPDCNRRWPCTVNSNSTTKGNFTFKYEHQDDETGGMIRGNRSLAQTVVSDEFDKNMNRPETNFLDADSINTQRSDNFGKPEDLSPHHHIAGTKTAPLLDDASFQPASVENVASQSPNMATGTAGLQVMRYSDDIFIHNDLD